jgi:DNA repair protein RecN (Recombination protein N)
MLNELVVEDLGPIERAEITLDAGSSALTGETGTGKTLVVAAVGLLLGARADKQMIREGAKEARAEGRFVVAGDHPAVHALIERGLVPDDVDRHADIDIVISRTVASTGSKARVNGRLAPIAVLADLGPLLVEIAGQHEHQRLSSRTHQRALLDAFAGPEAVALAADVAEKVRAASRARRMLEEAAAGERERARELDVLRFEIAEIEAANVQPGEVRRLTEDAGRLEHAETIATCVTTATESLRGERGVEDLLATASSALAPAIEKDPGLEPIGRRLDAVAYEVADIAQELAARVPEPDPDALETTRDRIGAIGRLRRKYGDEEEQILQYLERARRRAAELEAVDLDVERAEREVRELTEAATTAAEALSTLRRERAPLLSEAVEEALATLALPGARFEVAVSDAELNEGGIDAVELNVATGAGETPRPVGKIASGGELSRIALALHLLVSGSDATTMIFDEVDAGVGGEAAQAVGRALARVAKDSGAQVLVVTHLPQVAAFADAQYRVSRTEGARRGVAVHKVEGDDRVAELSRMLAGLPKSDRAREHAQELLELAASGAAS